MRMVRLTLILVIFASTYRAKADGPDIEAINDEVVTAQESLVHLDLKIEDNLSINDFFEEESKTETGNTDKAQYLSEGNVQHSAVTIADRKWSLPIPYVIDTTINNEAAVIAGLTEFALKTCITFVPKTTQTDYIKFVGNLPGCWSYLGKIGGAQTISLGSGCLSIRIIIHEIMHAIGFIHEQSRPDRNDHVTINWDNITPGKESQFRKALPELHSGFDVKYDYQSIMHYRRKAFTNNGLDTITPNRPLESSDFGPADQRLSLLDVEQVNRFYGCLSDGSWLSWGPWKFCSKECGGGVQDRYRYCSGAKCYGLNKESRTCNDFECEKEDTFCFPSDSYVRTDKGEKVQMKDIKVGEKVLTINSEGKTVYSKITMMMHKDAEGSGNNYIKIGTADKNVTMTPNHLFAISTNDFIFAKNVKAGHKIIVFNSEKRMFQTKEVEFVKRITQTGYYAPLTMEGTIVVDDVYVSCYGVIPSHSISHYVFSFWRFLFHGFESILSHSVDDAGIHWYPSMWMNTASYFNVI